MSCCYLIRHLASASSIVLPVLVLVLVLMSSLAVADGSADEVRIGLLAFRSVEQTATQWAPMARYLESRLDRPVRIQAMDADDIDRGIAAQALDFVITNPEHYLRVAARTPITAVATMVATHRGQPMDRFGGVIFVRADDTGVASLADVAGKRILAPFEGSAGGYISQAWTLHRAGVHLPADANVGFTGMPHDRVVSAVLRGEAEVGFVRTGILEAMAREGTLDLARLRIINRQPAEAFPLMLSSELLPEWPLLAMSGTAAPLTKAVVQALLAVPAGSDEASAAGIHGFAPPGNYQMLSDLRLKLKLHPDRLDLFDLSDVARKYRPALLILLCVLVVLAAIQSWRRLQYRRQAREAASRLAFRDGLLESLGEGVYGVDADGRCTFINDAALEMLRFNRRDVIGHDQHRLFHHHHLDGRDYPADECPIGKTLRDGRRRTGDEVFFRADGEPFPVRLLVNPLQVDGMADGAVVAFEDISELRRHVEEIKRMAMHDALTGLPNRRMLDARLNMELARGRRFGSKIALLFIDLDGFKAINDVHGHAAGDRVLTETAIRLRHTVRGSDTVARLAGDEFVVLLPDIVVAGESVEVAQKLIEVLRTPVCNGNECFAVTASVGIALWPDHGDDPATLLRAADASMYEAKQRGKDGYAMAGGAAFSVALN